MEKLQKIRAELAETVLEREDMILGLLLGLLTGRHVLFIGPPGTAKSMLVNEFSRRLKGGRVFSYLMTKFTKPDEIIGAVSLKGLENDDFRRILTGKVADSHFVFLDEIFHANSSCANTILTILNERKYHNGSEIVEAPLVMLVGATNELPPEINEELNAFYDRFLFRFMVDYISGHANLRKLLELEAGPGEPAFFTLDEMRTWQEEVKQVALPAAVANKLVTLVLKMREAGAPVSDRRLRECAPVLKAFAFLEGRDKVETGDLRVLEHVLWIRPEDRRIFKEKLYTVNLAPDKRAQELLAEAMQIKSRMDGLEDRLRRQALGGEMNLRLTEIAAALRELQEFAAAEGADHAPVAEKLARVQEIHADMIKGCLGMAADFE